MDNMKKILGTPCNESYFTNGKDRDQITFRFVTDDGNTPTTCTIRVGDVDPMTGEIITDLEIFKEYYKECDKQVHQTIKEMRPPYTREQKAWRDAEKEKFIREFREDHGYNPSKDDILWHMEQIEKERYHLPIDALVTDEDDNGTEKKRLFAVPATDPFGTDLPDEIQALRELAESLTPCERAVLQSMVEQAGGGSGRTTFADLTKTGDLSYRQIYYISQRLEKMIKEKIGRLL